MVRSIVRPVQVSWLSVSHSVAAGQETPRSQVGIASHARTSFTPSVPCGGAGVSTRPSCWPAATFRALALAADHGVKTIAFPAISCGAYRFPAGRTARIAVTETRRFLRLASSLEKALFVCFMPHIRVAYEAALGEGSPA